MWRVQKDPQVGPLNAARWLACLHLEFAALSRLASETVRLSHWSSSHETALHFVDPEA